MKFVFQVGNEHFTNLQTQSIFFFFFFTLVVQSEEQEKSLVIRRTDHLENRTCAF